MMGSGFGMGGMWWVWLWGIRCWPESFSWLWWPRPVYVGEPSHHRPARERSPRRSRLLCPRAAATSPRPLKKLRPAVTESRHGCVAGARIDLIDGSRRAAPGGWVEPERPGPGARDYPVGVY